MKLRLEAPNILRLRLSQTEYLGLATGQFLMEQLRWFRDYELKMRVAVNAALSADQKVQLETHGPLNIQLDLHPTVLEEIAKPSKEGFVTTLAAREGTWIIGIEVDLKK